MARIDTPTYELIDVRRIRSGGLSAQVAVRRIAYSPDRLYAWQGPHTRPSREWEQGALDTAGDFLARVRRELARSH
jgi:hypothetical protein